LAKEGALGKGRGSVNIVAGSGGVAQEMAHIIGLWQYGGWGGPGHMGLRHGIGPGHDAVSSVSVDFASVLADGSAAAVAAFGSGGSIRSRAWDS
jgi:hypothetical protein